MMQDRQTKMKNGWMSDEPKDMSYFKRQDWWVKWEYDSAVNQGIVTFGLCCLLAEISQFHISEEGGVAGTMSGCYLS
jgi:hypothetical protein